MTGKGHDMFVCLGIEKSTKQEGCYRRDSVYVVSPKHTHPANCKNVQKQEDRWSCVASSVSSLHYVASYVDMYSTLSKIPIDTSMTYIYIDPVAMVTCV